MIESLARLNRPRIHGIIRVPPPTPASVLCETRRDVYNEYTAQRLVYAEHIECGAYVDRASPHAPYYSTMVSRAVSCQGCKYFSHE